ncbi:hypothetical protein EMIHUDRAFT_465958 [Emiliania huxleyi CCMP1516]|uniref:Nucleotide-diphospho-sugar transferase domain-containing protein n=4 Tax=Emiliania huxleyi TaxID=2903 RepID=A0A0D3I3U2_EMIH1|nr:hypothetical protein EMIHUDRAFT_465958 [Emiliania huxleyi CCMP1516]EOD05927.1 hypothetical protein EMIHUDRAFT_465958 [Emiliania huxleyi CCMP1516]|eukprot:XP_005758356.1 hypothetical protein EMIHUDRAFT_465958 [Emiliania huxleyi CCMP1516]
MGARFTALLLVGAASLMILASSMFGSSSSGAGRIVHVTERGVAAARQQQLAATAAGSRSRLTNLAEAAPGGGGAAAPPLATATASAASPERPAARGALDGSLEAALRVAVPGEAPGFVMASFANSALNDHLVNFVLCAVRARAPFVIGAVDQAAFTMLSARRDAPTYVTPMAKEGASLDGSNQHSSGSWKRFAGMRTGEVLQLRMRTGEVLRMVRLGYSVLHTDIDVVWLRSPEPYLMCSGEASRPGGEHGPGSRFECGPLLSADVAVSSDNMSPGRDTEGRAFAEEWHANVVSPPPGSRCPPLRQRFREAALWAADPPPRPEARYLALNFSTPPLVQTKIDKYGRANAANIDVHSAALNACDRMWSGSDDIFHFGCMYPGSQDGKFVPFACPMDHVLSPAAWAKAEVDYRDAAILDQPQLRASGAVVDVGLEPRPGWTRKAGSLPLGTSAAEARELLKPLAATPVLRLPHARGLLCSIDDAAAFNSLADKLLRIPTWCAKCFQPCSKELAGWLPAEEIRRGGGWDKMSYCMKVDVPPKFDAGGACSLNVQP